MANEKKINDNGHKYVDLDLPSGTLWATRNVGASKPSDAGLYFQWGDTKGYTKEQVGIEENQKAFTWADYKYSIKGTSTFFTKYEKKGEALELEDDAANANLGGDWHMPTPEQIRELIDNTEIDRISQYGIVGVRFTSKKDDTKFIFIPAAGVAQNGENTNIRSYTSFWSSMLSMDNDRNSQCIILDSAGSTISYSGNHYGGLSIRGVLG